jgi:glutamine synthetase adenylyltransferase
MFAARHPRYSRDMDPWQRICDRSTILAKRLTQCPDWRARLMQDPFRTSAKPTEQLKQECRDWCDAARDPAQGLRHCKYYELLRLAWRDWNEDAPIDDLMREWSVVAEVIIREALRVSIHETFSADTDRAAVEESLTILGLGKLGAWELNISSDVDLIAVHTPSLSKALHAKIPTLLKHFSATLQDQTQDGFCFRVDWDLRPEGTEGPLVLSTTAAFAYYESRGLEWERMAFLRARAIAGNPEHGEDFLTSLHPFYYRRHVSLAILKTLRAMKEGVVQSFETNPWNCKLGAGGIREIEFVVHALQLLHAGRTKPLQTPSTIGAMEHLVHARLLPPSQGEMLLDAYRFLRRLENAIQIDGDRRLHTLPTQQAALDDLASRLGIDTTAMHEQITTHRHAVHAAFRLLFAHPYEKIPIQEAIEANFREAHSDEERIDGLTWSRRGAMQRILAEDLDGRLRMPEVCRRTTLVAEVIVDHILQIARRQVQERFGMPRTDAGDIIPFGVVALGSCGAFEMDYGSDLDLLFLFGDTGTTDGAEAISAQEYFSRLATKIISLLNLPHRYGRLYRVDTQLRPSGGSGVLVTSLEGFRRYHRDDSDLWERQAMLRARPIAGDAPFQSTIAQILQTLPFQHAMPTDGLTQLRDMRVRMERERGEESNRQIDLKFGPGGYADLEFLVQYVQLRHGAADPALVVGNTWRASERIANTAYAEIPASLIEAYTWLRRLLAHYRLATHSPTTRIDCTSKAFHEVITGLQLGNADAVRQQISEARTRLRNAWDALG